MGGGGQSSTTSNQYMPEDQQLRRFGVDYIHKAGGLGGRFSDESPAAYLDPWVSQVRNNYMSNLGQNVPMPGSDWQRMAQQAAMFNPVEKMGASAPIAQGLSQNPMSMAPQATGYNAPGLPQANYLFADPMSAVPTAMGGSINPYSMQQLQGFSPEAFGSDAMINAARNNLQRVIGPQIANNIVAGGSNPMSGAYAEAITNAGAQMALPITQQISQQQYGATMPQIQAGMNAQLQQQGAQQGLQGQAFGTSMQGLLGQQNAQNQYQGQGLQGQIQGNLGQQAAQNQFLGQGYGGAIQGLLGQQNAQNQMLGQGFGAQLQGGLNQQQNVFNQAMQTPTALNQLLEGTGSNYGQQMNLANMGQNAQQQEFLRQQALWQQVVSGMYGGGGMSPIGQTTSTSGGGGFDFGGGMSGGLGGAATGALLGTSVPVIGPGLGALIGGGMGLFGGGFCWIADALYGEGSEEAQAARAWVSEGWQGEEADEFREWYAEHGQEIAEALKKEGRFKTMHESDYRVMFNDFVMLGREYLKSANECSA